MKRPSFNEKTEVKVITHDYKEFVRDKGVDTDLDMYGWRGTVTKIRGFDALLNELTVPYTPDNYPTIWWVDVNIKSHIDGREYVTTFDNWPEQLEPVQKKFVDIDYIRETDLVIGKKADGTDAIRPKNTGAFEVGDIIQISTKIDGANASIAWDETTGKLEIFSRTNLLESPGALRGFYDYIKTNVESKLLEHMATDSPELKDYVIYGEWCVSHTVQYNKDWYNKWRVYDIWDKKNKCYLLQNHVETLCDAYGLEYIEELYYGPFISWDHCRSFIGKSTAYGPAQEGIVIKNQTKLNTERPEGPVYIKIVDEKFKEAQHFNKGPKPVDPIKEAEKQKAAELASTIVTEARVRKIILKLVDEGILPAELQPKDMGLVMKSIPKLVFEDVMKEEAETVKLLGEYAGKCISAETAKQARKIVVGG